jgi:hypothetical protein
MSNGWVIVYKRFWASLEVLLIIRNANEFRNSPGV